MLAKLNWESENWDTLYKRRSKETPDVRTCFIHFLLSFMMDSSAQVIKEFMAQKTRLRSIFDDGMMWDPVEIVVLVLDTLKTKMLENLEVTKTEKMKMFSSVIIRRILGLRKWTGSRRKAEDDAMSAEDSAARETVIESVVGLIRTLVSREHGITFHDPALGQGQGERVYNSLFKEVINVDDGL